MSFIFCPRCKSQAWSKDSPFGPLYDCPECGIIDPDGEIMLPKEKERSD